MITTIENYEVMLEAAIEKEAARLKTPDLVPDQPASWNVIGRRITDDNYAENAWVESNLSRERRRELSFNGKFGCYEGRQFYKKEPPLEVDTWDEYLAICARMIVERRLEAGCPIFDLYMSPKPQNAVAHQWPPIVLEASDKAERRRQLADGIGHLTELVATQANQVARLRAFLKVAKQVKADSKALEDAKTISAIDDGFALLDDEFYDGGENQYALQMASEADSALGLFFGRCAKVRGGSYSTLSEPALTYRIDSIENEIQKYGLAVGSVTLEEAISIAGL